MFRRCLDATERLRGLRLHIKLNRVAKGKQNIEVLGYEPETSSPCLCPVDLDARIRAVRI